MGAFHGMFRLMLYLLCWGFLTGCAGLPKGIEPVQEFELNRYLGRWYEVARLDHPFERGLTKVMAEYSLREDGDIKVVNRGYQADKRRWRVAEGRAKFVRSANEGYLKVSFIWPFYGAYVIVVLDQDYKYALVAGTNRNYLWILARTPDMDEKVRNRLIAKARLLGFDTDALIYPHADDSASLDGE